jgi:hypothetical protein
MVPLSFCFFLAVMLSYFSAEHLSSRLFFLWSICLRLSGDMVSFLPKV